MERSEGVEWSDEQIEAIERWKSKSEVERHPHDLLPGGRKSHERGMTEDECRWLRNQFESRDTTVTELSDSCEYSETAIAEHVFGRRCHHEHDVPPCDSPMGSINPDEFIQAQECAQMRTFFFETDNCEIKNVQHQFGTSYGQAYHHLMGRCKCDNDVDPIE